MEAIHTNDNNILTIKTVQIQPFRTLITALKDILIETNIEFSKNGIKICSMDKTHTILIHLILNASNFEMYECKKDRILIAVNMLYFFKLINSIDNDDTLTIYIENEDYNDGVVKELGLKFENGNIKQSKIQKLRLLEPDEEELDLPNLEFSSIINMPSCDFQKIVRDLANISEKLEIKSINSELIFKCSGQYANAEIRRSETESNMQYIKKDKDNIIQGEFPLKNLVYFIKCTNLCNQIEMYLKNDQPLIVKYNVATLGEIKLCLTPLTNNTLEFK
jgi:proliferating cell nuclear antigen|tara:strand:- start:5036 stop:5866 length:831 start_codon:yes stop_codon:yes gene_type:complete